MKRIVFIIALMLAISSCNKQINKFDYQQFDSTPTLNAILTAGDTIWAQVSLANKLNAVHPTICKDAEVFFYKDGEFLEKLKFDDESQLFIGDNIVESEHSYSCKVVIPDFDTVKASTFIPQKPQVVDFEVIELGYVNNDGEQRPSYLLTFATNPDKDLFYNTKFWTRMEQCNGYSSSHYEGDIVLSYETDDPVLLNEGIQQLVFSNKLITDETYTLKINGGFSSYSSGASFGAPNDSIPKPIHGKIVVSMNGLSESLYNYLKSFYKYYEADPYDNLFLGIINPTNYYSNVENGIGIFGAQACYVSDTIYYNMDR